MTRKSGKKPAAPPRARVTSQKQKPAEAPAAVSPHHKKEALAQATEAVRQKLWANHGQPLTTVEGVTIAFALLTRGNPHWHLMTFGLSLSGFELSLRVRKNKDEPAPPSWAVTLVGTLISRAKMGALTGAVNQVLVLADGLAPGTGTEHTSLLFTPDPEAPELKTPHETVPILLAVPITNDEAKAVREWSPTAFVEILGKIEPLLLSDLDRTSLLQAPRARHMLEQRIEKEGSSLSVMSAERSEVRRLKNTVSWTLSHEAVETLVSLLKGRTGHLRPFSVVAVDTVVDLVNAESPSILFDKQRLTVKLTLPAAREIRAIVRSKPAVYRFELLPDFELVVC
jgi:hypothetical protein